MKPDSFYLRVTQAAAHPPPDRHRLFSALHSEVASAYLAALQRIPSGQANQVVALGSDPRTLAQVVGHIAAWDQFAILAAGDILAGVQHPRMVTTVEGYKDREGQSLNFAGIEAFNAYQAAQHAAWSWDDIRELARRAATTLHVLFTHPGLLSVERLERTKPYRNRLGNGTIIQEITMGWTLWLTVLEHEAVEHAAELGIGQ